MKLIISLCIYLYVAIKIFIISSTKVDGHLLFLFQFNLSDLVPKIKIRDVPVHLFTLLINMRIKSVSSI